MRRLPLRRYMLATIALSTVATSGCYGTFPLTRKLHAYNKKVSSDKWVRELFFLATAVLVPVYSVAGLIDVVILNSQEFWTGKSSVASRPETQVKTLTRGNVTITQTMTQLAAGRTMVLEETVNGQFRSRTTLHQATGSTVVSSETVFADGRRESKTLKAEEAGTLTIANANGTQRAVSANELASALSRIEVRTVVAR